MNTPSTNGLIAGWKNRVRRLKIEITALSLACHDSRVPWYAKAFVACLIGYTFSPVDLIPDFIPVIGYLDDLILVPLGIVLALKMIPGPVLADCRAKAQGIWHQGKSRNWIAGGVVVLVWLLVAVWVSVIAAASLNG